MSEAWKIPPDPSIDAAAWEGLLALGERQEVRQGEVLFTDRSASETLFVVTSGLIEIYKESAGQSEVRLAILKEGDMFGERALFNDARRSAFARAYKDAVLCVMSAGDVKNYIQANPTFALQFYRFLCEHFSQIIYDLDMDIRSMHYRLSLT